VFSVCKSIAACALMADISMTLFICKGYSP